MKPTNLKKMAVFIKQGPFPPNSVGTEGNALERVRLRKLRSRTEETMNF